MANNRIKLIVSDIDGTLLTKRYEFAPGVEEAVAEARARGVIFVVCTGRMHAAAMRYARMLSLTEPIISYNGAVVKEQNGDVIEASYFSPSLFGRLLLYVEARGWYAQSYEDDEFYYPRAIPATIEYEEANKLKGHEVGFDGMLSRSARVPKLLVMRGTAEEADEALRDIKKSFDGEILAVKSTATYIEITMPGVSKGHGLSVLARRYGVSLGETMAMGDAGNDISMIEAAGVGVAMGNATDDVKAAADFVTTSVDDGGSAMAINRFVLGKQE